MTGVGDIMAQHYVEGISWKDHDIRRTIRFTCVGLFFIGPIFHAWYEMCLSKMYVQRTISVVTKKVILDQGFFAPTFLVMFYGMVGLFEMGPVERTLRRIKNEFVPNMTVNYFIWPAVQFVNFYYIHKPKYNILLVNSVSIFWNCFLSWAAHKRVHTTAKFDKEQVLVNDECKEKSKGARYKM